MASFKNKIQAGFGNGFKKGWKGYVWLLKILIPISFLTALLEYSGWLGHLNFLLEPAMGFIHLPPAAALPIVAGMLTGIYGAVAALTVIPLAKFEITLVAIFALISHALIQEGVIQGKSGLNGIKATLIRLTASVATVWAAGFFLAGPGPVSPSDALAVAANKQAFLPMVLDWSVAALRLSLQILGIVMTIMVAMETLKAFDLIPAIVRILSPFLKLMGLGRETGLMWVAAIFFGISYGAAVIVEEAREGDFDRQSLERLHISIGVNHSMVEDPLLFLPFGLNLFWLWIPRLITAIAAVRIYNLWIRLRGKENTKWRKPATGAISKS